MGDEWGDSGSTWEGGAGDASADTNNNSKGCRICKEEGHFARDCPNKKSGDNGCRICKEEGHFARDCPNKPEGEEGEGGGGITCFKCKGPHMAKDCEQPDKCRKCGEEGHMSKDCETGDKTHKAVNQEGKEVEIYVPTELSEDNLFEQGISSGINFDKFDKIPVKCSGDNVPAPVVSFDKMGLRQILQDNIAKSGYKKPTPIQKSAIPCIMAGRDLMGCAQTGSGKTAAFLIPIIHKILEDGCESGSGEYPQKPQAVIVAPTRELAIQIKDEARKFANGSMVKAVVAYGGTSTGFQTQQLMRGTNILIATPGRLNDFVDRGKVSYENLKFLVLDEADRMLDMGFHPEVIRICGHSSMPAKGTRQTLMFSATFPSAVQHLAIDFLENYLFLAIGIIGGASGDVTQKFEQVEKFGKRDKLVEILKEVGTDRTLVFVETKRNADFLASFLSNEGFPTTSIHGDRLQREREEALRDFKAGRMPILIATAVAARGLDIKGVAHVINYDLPKTIDEYVHRIGRTGRVGNTGKATSFFDPSGDSEIVSELVKVLAECGQEVPDYLADCGAGGGAGGAGFGGVDIRGGQAVQSNAADDDEW